MATKKSVNLSEIDGIKIHYGGSIQDPWFTWEIIGFNERGQSVRIILDPTSSEDLENSIIASLQKMGFVKK